MPSTVEIAEAFTALLRDGKFPEAGEAYWAADVVSLEATDGPMSVCTGIDAVRAKGAWWYENFIVHDVTVEGPFVHGAQFMVRFSMDVEQKGGDRMETTEVGLYTVKAGKISEERFFAWM